MVQQVDPEPVLRTTTFPVGTVDWDNVYTDLHGSQMYEDLSGVKKVSPNEDGSITVEYEVFPPELEDGEEEGSLLTALGVVALEPDDPRIDRDLDAGSRWSPWQKVGEVQIDGKTFSVFATYDED